MNNFFKIIFLFTLGLIVISCSKDDNNNNVAPPRDYAEQYIKDIANIESFMKTHYMTVTNSPGATEDQNVTFTLIPSGGTQVSIWDDQNYPKKLREVTVNQNDVDIVYKMYYIELRQGTGKSPSNVDRVLTSYRGEYIFSTTEQVNGVDVTTLKSNQFEESINPQSYFNLTGVIRGWSEIFPQFKTGTYSGNPDGVYPPNLDGTTSYYDFGAGVMFIPSGLAYFNNSPGGIPSYSPLIFSFKLYEIQRIDHDGDGIFSYQEDLNGDGYLYSFAAGIPNPDNTNAPSTSVLIGPNKYSKENEVPDFLDIDDDGDYFTTKSETSYINPDDPQLTVRYYPYNGAAFDDMTTPFLDETKGVPDCGGNFTNLTRLRKYRDATCH
jgi:hypothetical protein